MLKHVHREYSLGLVVIEHDVPLIMSLCERIHVLDHGETLAHRNAGRDQPQRERDRPPTSASRSGRERAMLTVENLSVRYGARPSPARRVDRTSAPGELVAVVGPNGAGKSTLAQHDRGTRHAPREGAITLRRRPACSGSPPERIVRLGLGLVPEGRHIFETLSVGENLKLGAHGQPRRDDAPPRSPSCVRARFPVLRGATWTRPPAGSPAASSSSSRSRGR